MSFYKLSGVALVVSALMVIPAAAQQAVVPAQQVAEAPVNAPASVPLPAGYLIGPEDVLSIVFWKDKDMSAEVVVRPDGKISLPLVNEVQAAGLTPEQLRTRLTEAASKFVTEPTAAVVVKEIHSRKVFITGMVAKPGTYPLMDNMTVLQLIAVAGGLQEYADSSSIVVMRNDNGQKQALKFNYKDVIKQKHVEQNVALKSGDTVIVP